MRVQFEQRPEKSGKPAVRRCSRQFRVRASIRASVYLPDPCAPERMTACGNRLRASISRRRWMVSGLPTKSENGIETILLPVETGLAPSLCVSHPECWGAPETRQAASLREISLEFQLLLH